MDQSIFKRVQKREETNNLESTHFWNRRSVFVFSVFPRGLFILYNLTRDCRAGKQKIKTFPPLLGITAS